MVQGVDATSRDGYEISTAYDNGIRAVLENTGGFTGYGVYIGSSGNYNSVKIVSTGSSILYYFNDNLKMTKTTSEWVKKELMIVLSSWSSGQEGHFKNLKIKPYTE